MDVMQEDTPEEVDTARKMRLNEKVTSLEKEKEEMWTRIQQTERLALHERAAKETSERFGIVEAAITKIAEHVERPVFVQ